MLRAVLVAFGALWLPRAAAVAACDPLVPENCMYPFPNDFYRADGHVALSRGMLPKDKKNQTFDPTLGGWNGLDGFPALSPIVSYFANASLDNCARFWNIETSLAKDSPIVLLNAETGNRVAHWVELDHYSDSDLKAPYPRALLLWPAARLDDATRYIVAFRDMRTVGGGPVAVSSAFAALRDNTSDPRVDGRRAHFESIFASLDKAGVARDSLQLAWDFTTTSRESVTGRMVSARDDALSRLKSSGFKWRVLSKQDNVSPSVARKIEGQFLMPWYLNSTEANPSVRLVLDSNGEPVFQGLQPVNFTLLLPTSAVAGGKRAGVLQYGHGLFGSREEVNSGYLTDQANEQGYALLATDWIGLSEQDEVWVAYILGSNLANFTYVPDRCTQGMLNALAAMRLVTTELAGSAVTQPRGKPTLDPSLRFYDGNSQGGILGAVYMGVTQDVERGTLGVPGGPYSLLLPRSVDFVPLANVLNGRYLDPLDRAVIFVLLQMVWDRCEPSGYMSAVARDPLPNTPAHRVLVHYGLGDAQVTWLGAQALARSIGAHMYASNVPEGNETFYGYTTISDNTVRRPAARRCPRQAAPHPLPLALHADAVLWLPDSGLRLWQAHRPLRQRAAQQEVRHPRAAPAPDHGAGHDGRVLPHRRDPQHVRGRLPQHQRDARPRAPAAQPRDLGRGQRCRARGVGRQCLAAMSTSPPCAVMPRHLLAARPRPERAPRRRPPLPPRAAPGSDKRLEGDGALGAGREVGAQRQLLGREPRAGTAALSLPGMPRPRFRCDRGRGKGDGCRP